MGGAFLRAAFLPAAFLTSAATEAGLTIDAVDAHVRISGLVIRDVLNDAPNTCYLKVDGTAPQVDQVLRVTLNTGARVLFAGTLQTVDQSYEGKPNQLAWSCTAIDDTARANMKRPFGTWVTVSATTIAEDLVADFAPDFADTGIDVSLPPVSITFDGSASFIACLARLADAIGGYCKVEDGVVYLFLTDTAGPPDDIDSTPGRFLNDPPITMSEDVSQLRTRVYGKGYGENVTTDVAAGETIIPLPIGNVGNPLGGQAITGTTPDGAQSQVIDYTGVQVGGGGSLVGPGASPSSAPTLALLTGTGMDAGLHELVVQFETATGPSASSPVASITTLAAGVVTPPPAASVNYTGDLSGLTGLVAGDLVYYRVTYINANGETTGSNTATLTVQYGNPTYPIYSLNITLPTPPDPTVTHLRLYRNRNGSWDGNFGLMDDAFWGSNFRDHGYGPGSFTGGAPPGSNTATVAAKNQISLTAIPLGPTSPVATTARKVYVSPVGGGARKLGLTISDNTTQTGTITASDATLAAAAAEPTSDTSGLTQPDGQILPGATAILVAGLAPFQSGGGWWFTGTQFGRYTGFTGSSLTGVTGVVQTLTYNTVIAASPALTGVTGLTLPMLKGSAVHIWVQRDDATAQAAQAARAGSGDGIVEYTIFDGRRGEASLIARCDADLALFAYPIVTVKYACRDVKTKSGKTVVIDLASPLINETLTIQDVTIDQIDIVSGLAPRFMVTASSVRWSLEDTLRRLLSIPQGTL